jgi:hypothetical protein
MNRNRVSEMTDDEIRHLAHPLKPVTYDELAVGSITDHQHRYAELTQRDAMARALATLWASGTYDPQRHGVADEWPPLTVEEHLEVLALGTVIGRYYQHPSWVDRAVQAGASWTQVVAATGTDEATARREYRAWADGQHRLYQDCEGRLGMSPADYTAAITWAQDAEGEAAR